MHELANHPLVILAAILCSVGIVFYCLKHPEVPYPTFTFLYAIGITFWFSFGLEIKSVAVSVSSLVQMIFLYRQLYNRLRVGVVHGS